MKDNITFNQRHWVSCPEVQHIADGHIDLTGVKFGRFTVIGKHSKSKRNGTLWVVRCECGDFETRCNRSVKNPDNFGDRCELCWKIANDKRRALRKSSKHGEVIDARKL